MKIQARRYTLASTHAPRDRQPMRQFPEVPASGARRSTGIPPRLGGSSPTELSEAATVRLEIRGAKLYQLLESGHLCAAEVRGLDRPSKQRIWRYCLRACGRCLHRLCIAEPPRDS